MNVLVHLCDYCETKLPDQPVTLTVSVMRKEGWGEFIFSFCNANCRDRFKFLAESPDDSRKPDELVGFVDHLWTRQG